MKLLLSTARRRAGSQWVCHTCRGIKYALANSLSPPKHFTSPSSASLELRRNGPARTRFAPSPTGYLHLGSLRTALFNYLVAKASGGQFLLRIEDTDQKRTVHDAEERLFRDLEWAGIEWDEGPKVGGPYGPYKQSQRTALYREHAEHLLQSGNAYRCFCTPERLNTLAQYRSKLGLPPDYDRTCAHISREESDDRASQGEAHVVRLMVPDKYPPFNDLVYGLVRQRRDLTTKARVQASVHGSFDDPILMKTDGFPTYHLANVVDDHLMNITHVIRGSEWMSSTPKHLAMYEAFGWSPPKFAHVGLLLDKDRQKLSKRLESLSIADLRDKQGVFPETLTNFVALLGWSHNESSDVMNMQELIQNASLKFTRGDTVVGLEKLWFLQKRHAARYASLPSHEAPTNPAHDLTELALKPLIKLLNHDPIYRPGRFSFFRTIPEGSPQEDFVHAILWADAQNYTTPAEFIERNTYFFSTPATETLLKRIPGLKLHKVPAGTTQPSPETFLPFFNGFSEIAESDWNTVEIKSWVDSVITQGAMESVAELTKRGEWSEELDAVVRKAWSKLVHQYLRWALVAGMPGPDGSETMRILGKEETARRLEVARGIIHNRAEEVDNNGETA